METLRASLNEQAPWPDSWPLIWIPKKKKKKITSNKVSPQTMPSPEDLKQLARANMLITQSKSGFPSKVFQSEENSEENWGKIKKKKKGGGIVCVCVCVGGGGMYVNNTRYLCNRDFHYKKNNYAGDKEINQCSQRYGQSNLCHSPWGKPRQS